jgi:outer membrane protein assembly factor BamA
VRSLFLLLALAFGGGYLALRHAPERDAQADAMAPAQPQQIQSVSLDGRDLPVAALREALTAKPGDMIDLAALERDRLSLEDTLVARGYLAAHVAAPRVSFGPTGATFVTFPIEQGALYRIRNVTVTGASDTEAGVVTLGSGETADAARIGHARQALESRLDVRSKSAAVDVKLTPDRGAGVVDIELVATRPLSSAAR